jgi:hypothetical protein
MPIEQFGRLIATDSDKWAATIKRSGVKPE